MTLSTRRFVAIAATPLLLLAACSQASAPESTAEIVKETVKVSATTGPEYDYMLLEKFDTDMGAFVGLVAGESFAESEPKIDAVFTAYEGHAAPFKISKKKDVVEAGWTQVLVTQDGLMDGTIAGQQLLAIYDENDGLVTYGMRIKCHTDDGVSDWQNTVCE